MNRKKKFQRKEQSMSELLEAVKKAAKTDINILITGESGVGKEVFARKIVEISQHKKPFVVCDCTQLSEQLIDGELFGIEQSVATGVGKRKGLVEIAEGGTLLLDEIGDMPIRVQAKLLRLIQNKTYCPVGGRKKKNANVRIIITTNRDLEEMVKKNTFRKDLFDQIRMHDVHIPPLRERTKEIQSIGNNILKKSLGNNYRDKKRISKEVYEELKKHDWPGNVRELENSITRAIETSKGKSLSYSDIVISQEHFEVKREAPLPEAPSIKQLEKLAKKFANINSTILIIGETGVGKGYWARRISKMSKFKEPFVVCDCSQVGKGLMESELFGYVKGAFTGANKKKAGLVESADGGTLFIDEIGDVPLDYQGKFLRLVDEKKFRKVGDIVWKKLDAKIIAATNKDLKDMVGHGTFREDLFFRFNSYIFEVPPLREMRNEIPSLVRFFLKEFLGENYRDKKRISQKVCKQLMKYAWPGNIRELRNSIEKAVKTTKGRDLKYDDIVKARAG